MKIKQLLSAALVVATLFNFTSCKEDDEPSQIPTIPTTFGLEDGAEIKELSVTLSAKGSTVEDENLNVSYVYYIGKSKDELNETSAKVTLEPYTQYFWCARAKTEGGESEMTEIRTFYCVPEIDIMLSRAFGNNEDATTIKWEYYTKQGDNKVAFNFPEAKRKQTSITIDISSDEIQSNIKSVELTENADSAYIKKDVDNGIILTKKYVRGTINGKEETFYEEAYKYDFKVTMRIPVGDRFVEVSESITSILVDEDEYAIDDELNIYRTVKIDNVIWTIDNYRGTHVKHVVPSYAEYADFGFYSYWDEYAKNINTHILNGYHVSTEEDWNKLENYLGMEYPTHREGTPTTIHGALIWGVSDLLDILKCDDITKYANCFASNVPWHVFDSDYNTADIESISKYPFSFNVHYVGISSDWNLDLDYSEVGEIAFFLVHDGFDRIVSKKYQSIGKYTGDATNSVRLVKDRK